MVLSGGLGNSAYVRDQLRIRYGRGNSSHFNARNLQIRVAPDPQLVVCKGIVADRVQKLKSGQSVLGWRCCRSSYGLLCKVKHDPNNPAHHGLNTSRDPLDGQLYITDYIDWFIKQVSLRHPVTLAVPNGQRASRCQAISRLSGPLVGNAPPRHQRSRTLPAYFLPT